MQTRDLKDRIISLLELDHMLSAQEIVTRLAKSDTAYNRSSVYRALDQLVEAGSACEHNFTGKQTLYELRSHHHAHLYCSSCGTIEIAPREYTQPKTVGQFAIDHHHITLIGTCLNCQKNA